MSCICCRPKSGGGGGTPGVQGPRGFQGVTGGPGPQGEAGAPGNPNPTITLDEADTLTVSEPGEVSQLQWVVDLTAIPNTDIKVRMAFIISNSPNDLPAFLRVRAGRLQLGNLAIDPGTVMNVFGTGFVPASGARFWQDGFVIDKSTLPLLFSVPGTDNIIGNPVLFDFTIEPPAGNVVTSRGLTIEIEGV